jgi:excinuclease UvrABC ATPase subunit
MEDAVRCQFYAGPIDPRHPPAMPHADRLIDLGPGAGHDGGRIVFEGTPADLVAARSTLTGEHLAAYVGT